MLKKVFLFPVFAFIVLGAFILSCSNCTPPCNLAAPINLKVKIQSPTSALVSWKTLPSPPSVYGYKLWIRDTITKQLRDTVVTNPPVLISNLVNGNVYQFWVAALCSINNPGTPSQPRTTIIDDMVFSPNPIDSICDVTVLDPPLLAGNITSTSVFFDITDKSGYFEIEIAGKVEFKFLGILDSDNKRVFHSSTPCQPPNQYMPPTLEKDLITQFELKTQQGNEFILTKQEIEVKTANLSSVIVKYKQIPQ
jgi:hypothetical protein